MYHGVTANNGQNKVHNAFKYETFVKSDDTESEEAVVFSVAFLGSLYQLSSYPVLLSLNVSSKYVCYFLFHKTF